MFTDKELKLISELLRPIKCGIKKEALDEGYVILGICDKCTGELKKRSEKKVKSAKKGK